MCLVFVAWRDHPRYRLVVAANRDEFHARPTAPAAAWESESARILAGRDLVAGGTWLGVTADGRFAALTNVSGSVPPRSDPPSRGRLVLDHLRSGLDAGSHAHGVAREAGRYSGFNLLLADRDGLFCVTNRSEDGLRDVPAGCHGLGNDRLNAREPKVTEGLAGFRRVLAARFEADDLFALLADEEPAAATDGREDRSSIERARTARFIRNPVYGTRSSTVLFVDRAGSVSFEERTFDSQGLETGRVAFECRDEAADGFRTVAQAPATATGAAAATQAGAEAGAPVGAPAAR